jgi:NitT/TauT family transport system substrate-binding protein
LPARASETVAGVRIGVLRYGTVAWAVDVMRHHALDAAAQVQIVPVEFAAAQAAQVALQAGHVDMVVLDWLWVARQRGAGADWTFVPFSNAVGALITPPDSAVHELPDLAGRTLGIAGSPLDKSWLILRAYAQKRYRIDLDAATNRSFGPPPLLAEEMKAGRLDAVLTYWPFAAKAEASGARSLLAVDDAVTALGIAAGVPYIGYVFSQAWAMQNQALVDGFVAASRKALTILAISDEEWQRLKPLTGAADDAELMHLRDWFRRGIPRQWDTPERDAASRLFDLLADTGGPDLVGPIRAIPAGTFWPITWHPDA